MQKEKQLTFLGMWKTFTKAPLPFQGQKRMHVKAFAKVIKDMRPALIVDLFGGSGILSHVAKRIYPNATVIYNDFDNYCERLKHIPETNTLLFDIREMLRHVPEKQRIDTPTQKAIYNYLTEADRRLSYIDWKTILNRLLFSGKYVDKLEQIRTTRLYNSVGAYDYNADGYLDGLEVVHCDYRELLEQYRKVKGALFIADPPYLSTDVKFYNNVLYWKLIDYLNIISGLAGLKFIYFTSNKSQIVELCNWIRENKNALPVFNWTVVNSINSTINHIKEYEDIMLVNDGNIT